MTAAQPRGLRRRRLRHPRISTSPCFRSLAWAARRSRDRRPGRALRPLRTALRGLPNVGRPGDRGAPRPRRAQPPSPL
ncbi:MAG: hypothetical protein M0C28_47915 [Candidatus Moduliflexus flocculans]|nr:hypothetical protein [Candidatus Moduliflexus flocculans]